MFPEGPDPKLALSLFLSVVVATPDAISSAEDKIVNVWVKSVRED